MVFYYFFVFLRPEKAALLLKKVILINNKTILEMKKIMSKLFVAMVAMATCVGFVACDNNNQDDQDINLAGKWVTQTDTFQELLMIEEDHSVMSLGSDGEDIWMGVKGQITLKGNRFEMIFEDGENDTGTFTLKDNVFTIITDDGETLEYKKLVENLSVVGQWEYSNVICHIKATADEISLPVGSTVDGEVIPTTIKTSQIKGEFVEDAIGKYFKNVEFENENTLKYTMTYNDSDSEVTKNYTIANNIMTISGDYNGIEHTTSFMVFQSPDFTKTFLLVTKEPFAEMFVGYAHMLRQNGTSSGSEEALEAFKQEFLSAFENYAVIIVLDAK